MKIKTLYDLTEQIIVSAEIQDKEFYEMLRYSVEYERLLLVDRNQTLVYKKWSDVQNDFNELFSVLRYLSRKAGGEYYHSYNTYYYDIQQLDNDADITISVGVYSDGEDIDLIKYRVKFELIK